jgi:hypothetical protein
MMMIVLSEFIGTDTYSDRKAIIVDTDGVFGVQYIINDNVKEYRVFPDRALNYAEDAAENWVSGVINPQDLLVNY